MTSLAVHSIKNNVARKERKASDQTRSRDLAGTNPGVDLRKFKVNGTSRTSIADRIDPGRPSRSLSLPFRPEGNVLGQDVDHRLGQDFVSPLVQVATGIDIQRLPH